MPRSSLSLLPLVPLALAGATACGPMSAHVRDPAAGLNGGFETVAEGLPVNWLVHTPDTVPDGRFTVTLDERDPAEGARSLHFDVEACSDTGGRFSPGLATEIEAEPGATYEVAFRLRATGCAWTASAGGVGAKTGNVALLASSPGGPGTSDTGWHTIRRAVTVAPGHERLRFELSVTSPGRLWIDDVRIERADGDAP